MSRRGDVGDAREFLSGDETWTYFNTAAVGLAGQAVADAYEAFLSEWIMAGLDYVRGEVAAENARSSVAKFLLHAGRGLGYCYLSPRVRDDFIPINAGWKAGAVPVESFFDPRMELSSTAPRFDNSISWLAAVGNEAASRRSTISARTRSTRGTQSSRRFSDQP